jgi:CheY-like chemotaxis protein
MAKILLIDDEKEILDFIENELSFFGHEVVCAKSPVTALALLENHHNQFDFILCDVVMPNKNGIDFVQEIKKIPWVEAEIIMMSNYVASLTDELSNIGITNVLKKPFSTESLLSLFKTVPVS